MLIYDYVPQFSEPTAVALGFFDGVHLGHTAVLNEVVGTYGLRPVVFTFSVSRDLPVSKSNMGILFSDDDRKRLLEEKGIEIIVMPSFSSIKDMSADDFFKSVLAERLFAKRIACGDDFRFGKNAVGNVRDLQQWSKKYGIDAVVCSQVQCLGTTVSSSKIREALKNGKVKEANLMLGRPYSITGKVVHGNKMGRKIGVPTANQEFFDGQLVPKRGVYASAAEIDGKWHFGITNIGCKPTVKYEGNPLAETHFPFYNGDLYGKEITVVLFEYIRKEKAFSSLDELKGAIMKDIANAEKIWKNLKFI